MADPRTYRPAPGSIPTEPGVYRFRDEHGRVIYVGKAKNLRSRLSSYFADLSLLHPRTRRMVLAAAGVQWTVVSTEVEALQLEYTWIKKYDPRFNVRYRDDKTYPMLAVTVGEEFPRAFVYRGPRRPGTRYFGPYSHAWAIRDTLDTLQRVFPVRSCSAGVFKRQAQLGRPCLLGYIDKCAAPCIGRVTPDEHRAIVNELIDFLAGRTDAIMRRIEKRMLEASADLDFERAARLRDDLGAMRRAMEKQAVVLGDGTDADVVGVEVDELQVSVQVFHVRGGRIRGQRGWVVEHAHGVDADGEFDAARAVPGVVSDYLAQFYGGEADLAEAAESGDISAAVPREVLVPALPEDADELADWLSALRGSRVSLRVPQRGDKRALAETVHRNAVEALTQHKLRRSGDLTARSAALQEIQETLELDSAPLRIECVDISHTQGTDVMASLVVFEDGIPRKSDYRLYRIRDAAGDGHSDDVGSIAEVTRRRFRRHHEDPSVTPDEVDGPVDDDAGTGGTAPAARRFAYPPQLFVVDGGRPQVEAAAEVLSELGVTDVPVVGIAKRLEEIWLPGEEYPVIFPRHGEGLFLLQRLRDEAHRFAIRAHRGARSRRMTASVLDDVPGLGPTRRAALVETFPTVSALRAASTDELCAVPGIGPGVAAAIRATLGGAEPADAAAADVGDSGGQPDRGQTDQGQTDRGLTDDTR
ncbi:excinuclease ABC subunit UvrC [Dietzia maris]|uniref:excinuclease ABC subunit UvrC n=1 Tax=Dietzia maris TaxID=37915 RepID=UPI0021AFFA1F|nr:excinuclease ABC subunit UvrC [Dietzia maris]MCT1434790.1 excinuclease ABC subunit UvrC [Dietzia maris]MCT1521966.1 excinuclease ABC subunit UvrC [Dietzia maris]